MPWEAEALYNNYLARLLDREGMKPGAIRFHAGQDRSTLLRLTQWSKGEPEPEPLYRGKPAMKYPGWMLVRHPE